MINRGIRQRILAGVRDGADTVRALEAVLEDLTRRQIASNLASLHREGKCRIVDRVKWPGERGGRAYRYVVVP